MIVLSLQISLLLSVLGFWADLSSHFHQSNWYDLGTKKKKSEIAQCRKKRLSRRDQLSKPVGAKPSGSIGVRQGNRSISHFSLGPEEGNGSGWGCATGWAAILDYTVGAAPVPIRWATCWICRGPGRRWDGVLPWQILREWCDTSV